MQRQPGHPVRIAGTGAYLPGDPIPYDDIDRVLGPLDDASDDVREWYPRAKRTMRQLLGMEHYYFAIDPETRAFTDTPSTLAAKAGQQALDAAGMTAADVDIVFYAGCSQDAFICPPTSTFVQQHLGIERCAEVSIHSNCTSTYKAIQIASDQIAMGRYRTALITSANMVSGHALAATLNQKVLTRHQAMLRLFLCDGGGALVLTRDDGASPGFEVWDTYLESVGASSDPQMYSLYGSASVAPDALALGHHHVTQNMQMVGSLAVDVFCDGFDRFAKKIGLDPSSPETQDAIQYFLANVPSDHLVDAAHEVLQQRYGVSPEISRRQYYSTVAKRGYTGPAAIAVALDQLRRTGVVDHGRFVVSFVTESSKWMNAGFLLRYRAA